MQQRTATLFLLLSLALLAEFFLFRSYYAENISPYYPRMWDQVATFEHVYRAHYALRDKGVSAAFGPGGPIADLAFKSSLVPVLGTILTFFFGPDRLSVGMVNFLIFVGAQALVGMTLYRLRGWTACAAGWGLLLLSQSHWINGLFDLRFDYAGLLAFGVIWVAFARYFAGPSRANLLYLIASLAFGAAARSITLVYAVTMSGLVVGLLVIPTFIPGLRQLGVQRLKNAGVVFAVSIGAILTFTASQWLTLRGYYGSQAGTLAGEIRWAEVGAFLFKDRITWYPLNWWPHYGKLVTVAITVAAVCLAIELGRKLWNRRNNPPAVTPVDLPPWPWRVGGSMTLLFAATIALFVSSAVHGPNIAVIGMLTIPTSITAALVVSFAVSRLSSPFIARLAICVVAVLGAADWTQGMVRAREMNSDWRERGEVGRKVLETLAQNVEIRENPKVLFLWTHDIFNTPSFEGYEMETRQKLPPVARFTEPSIVELVPDWFRDCINGATCVVGYLKPPSLPAGQYEWPSLASIRKLQGYWQPMLDKDFILVGSWHQPCESSTIGLWTRKVTFGHIDTPGLDTHSGGIPAFWLRREPSRIELINATGGRLPIVLSAPAWPGPGREQTARVTVTAVHEGEGHIPVVVNLSAATRFDLHISLDLQPGTNVVWLSASESEITSPPPHQGASLYIPALFIDVSQAERDQRKVTP